MTETPTPQRGDLRVTFGPEDYKLIRRAATKEAIQMTEYVRSAAIRAARQKLRIKLGDEL